MEVVALDVLNAPPPRIRWGGGGSALAVLDRQLAKSGQIWYGWI